MGNFQFKYFAIQQQHSTLKVGTDAMILGASISREAYKNILDVGTGTGVLALMAKQLNPLAKITAIDIDLQSAIDCQHNFGASPWQKDFTYLSDSIFELKTASLFDCIVSNPPYYENGLLSHNENVNSVKHTQNFDLQSFFKISLQLLSSEGEMWIILPSEHCSKWLQFTTSIGLFPKKVIYVYGKPGQLKRVIVHLGKTQQTLQEEDLTIRDKNNAYTDQYKLLTKEFHNKTL